MATKQRARKQAAPLEVFDLNIAEQRKRFKIENENENADKYSDAANLEAYVTKGKDSPVRVGETQLFNREQDGWNNYEDFYVLRADGLLYADSGVMHELTKAKVLSYNRRTPTAVIVPTEKRVGRNKLTPTKRMILLNGDENVNTATQDLDGWDFPTISFECVNRFFDIRANRTTSYLTQLARLFADGTLLVVDYNPDVRKPLSKSEKAQLTKHNRNSKLKPPLPPEPGYTLVGKEWHRPATVVIRDTREKGTTMLTGQDEGTYFGVELPAHAKTVKEAFEILMPPEAKNSAGVKRQGEWFFVPVSQRQVPELDQCVATCEDTIALAVETPDSNKHLVYSGDIRVGKDGFVYASDPRMVHDAGEHQDVRSEGWIKFVRNTATRSFSVAGVD